MQQKNSQNSSYTGIGQRLKLEMKKRGLSSVDLAAKADVKTSFLYDVISGKSANPSSIKLARVADALGVNLAYLAGASDSPTEGYQFALPSDTNEQVVLARLSVDLVDGTPKISRRTYPDEALRFRKDWLSRNLRASAEHLHLFSVQGDSMFPTLNAGDTVLVDTSLKSPSPAGLFLLFDGLALVVKRLESVSKNDGRLIKVISDNSRYAAYETSIDTSSIVGRVVWMSRCL